MHIQVHIFAKINISWLCYITEDPETHTHQNRIYRLSYKLSLEWKTSIIQKMTKNITFFIIILSSFIVEPM